MEFVPAHLDDSSQTKTFLQQGQCVTLCTLVRVFLANEILDLPRQ